MVCDKLLENLNEDLFDLVSGHPSSLVLSRNMLKLLIVFQEETEIMVRDIHL